MSPQKVLVAELSHQINNPLAVIRNALYLAGMQATDPAVRSYLQIADESVTAVVAALRQAQAEAEMEPAAEALHRPAHGRALTSHRAAA